MSVPAALAARAEHPPLRALWLLCGLGALLRIAFVLFEPATRPVADELTWIGWSIESPAGVASPEVGFSPLKTGVLFYPPGYPYFVGALYALFGTLTAVKLAQCLIGALLVPAVGRVAWRVGGATAGRVAGCIAAAYPDLIWFAAHFWSETLFVTVLWWAFERVLAAREGHSWRTALGAGLLWGLAILIRENGLYFTPVLALWLLGRRPGKVLLLQAAAFLLAAVCVIVPWTWRNWTVYHAFIPVSTAGGLNLWQGNAQLTRQEVYDRYFPVQGMAAQYQHAREMGLAAIRERQPGWIFEKLRSEMPLFWEADGLALVHIERGAYGPVGPGARLGAVLVVVIPYLALLALFVVGLALVPPNAHAWLLLGFLAYYNLIHVVTHGFARYRLPAMPVVFVFAACGLVAWRARASGTPARRGWAAATALVLGLAVLPSLRDRVARLTGGADAPAASEN
jgi:Dolichyl-phosphate-mannose-protein mannosyltransferase